MEEYEDDNQQWQQHQIELEIEQKQKEDDVKGFLKSIKWNIYRHKEENTNE